MNAHIKTEIDGNMEIEYYACPMCGCIVFSIIGDLETEYRGTLAAVPTSKQEIKPFIPEKLKNIKVRCAKCEQKINYPHKMKVRRRK